MIVGFTSFCLFCFAIFWFFTYGFLNCRQANEIGFYKHEPERARECEIERGDDSERERESEINEKTKEHLIYGWCDVWCVKFMFGSSGVQPESRTKYKANTRQ